MKRTINLQEWQRLGYILVVFLMFLHCVLRAQTPAGFTQVAYEGFNYSSGSSLLNANGGSGWTTAWLKNYQNRFLKTGTAGFTYTGLTTTGLRADYDSNCSGTCNQIAALKRTFSLNDDGVVYLQFITVLEATGGFGTPTIRMFNGSTQTFGIGANSGSYLQLLDSGLNALATTSATLSNQNFVILRVDYTNSKTEMWVNPTLSTFDYANPTSPDASVSDFAPLFDQMQIFIRSGSIDEISVFYKGPDLDLPDTTFGVFSPINRPYFSQTYSIRAPSTNNSNPIVYTSDNPAVATISGDLITFTGIGTANITATQAADANYDGNSTSTVLTVVGKAVASLYGGVSTTDVNYVDANGKKGGTFGLDKYGKRENLTDAVVSSGLVLHLDAGNSASYAGTGTTWNDLSGNGNNGVLNGGVTFSASDGGALVFDGANDYFETDANIDLTGTDEVTIQVLVKTTTTGTQLIAEHSVNWNANNSFGLAIENNKMLFTDHNQGYNSNYSVTSINDGEWHLLTGTIDRSLGGSDQNKLYVDGEDPNYTVNRDLQADNNGNYQSHKFYVGSRAGSSYFFDGIIAQVLLYDRALTSEEIQQNFNAIGVAYGL
jgi:hypothetical protein